MSPAFKGHVLGKAGLPEGVAILPQSRLAALLSGV